MNIFDVIYAILALSIVLGIIVIVHEFGHFIAARLTGVRVETFSIGFGKRIFGRKIGKTDFRVSIVPLGGYVKMAGEDEFEKANQEPDHFQAKNRLQKFFILFMGPFMNLLLAFLIITVLNIAGRQKDEYRQQPPVIQYVEPGSPAQNAGLQKNDLIIKVAGEPVPNWRAMEIAFNSLSTPEVEVIYQRGMETRKTTIVLKSDLGKRFSETGLYWEIKTQIKEVIKGSPAEKSGLARDDILLSVNDQPVHLFELTDMLTKNIGRTLKFKIRRGEEEKTLDIIPAREKDTGIIGVQRTAYYRTVTEQYALFPAMSNSIAELVELTELTYKSIKRIISGKLSAKAVSGPIEIAKFSKKALESGLGNFFILIAFISLQLGIVNLLPIPVLDGGHLMILGIEGTIRRDFSPRVKTILMNLGFALLIALMVFVILNDIAKNLPNGWGSFLPF